MKTAFVLMISLLNIACNYPSIEETKLEPLPQNTVSVIPAPQAENLSDVDEDIVYGQVLESVAYGKYEYNKSTFSFDHTDWFDKRATGNWLAVRRRTISPENLDEVKSFSDLPEDLINDFIEKNKTQERLNDDYDVKFALGVNDFKGAMQSFFKEQDRKWNMRDKSWALRAVVGLSRVGFTISHKQSLVYVEFYNPVSGLQKKYCLTTWKREGIGLTIEDVKFFQ